MAGTAGRRTPAGEEEEWRNVDRGHTKDESQYGHGNGFSPATRGQPSLSHCTILSLHDRFVRPLDCIEWPISRLLGACACERGRGEGAGKREDNGHTMFPHVSLYPSAPTIRGRRMKGMR